METLSIEMEDSLHVCVERPDGSTYLQLVPNDFYSLLDFKSSLGKDYWITEIF